MSTPVVTIVQSVVKPPLLIVAFAFKFNVIIVPLRVSVPVVNDT